MLCGQRREGDGDRINRADLDTVITPGAFIPVADPQAVSTRFFGIGFPSLLHVNRIHAEYRLTATLETLLAVKRRGAFFVIYLNCGKSWC